MGADRLRITTDEQRHWLSIARARGGLCAGCGRALAPGEPVYIERLEVERKPLAAPGAHWGQRAVYRDVPLGVECASARNVAEAQARPPEACVGCGRPVHYAVLRESRQWVSCSKRCVSNRARLGGRPG